MEQTSNSHAASGFVLVNKPAGITSHDAVNRVRTVFGVRRVGHAGTLDPLATGLLIIGVGTATKKLETLLRLPKTYAADVTLGATSTTDDAEGNITQTPSAPAPARDDVERVMQTFIGEQLQTPPVFSSIKVRGVPAHRRTRRGEQVTLAPRTVTIYELRLCAYTYPILSFEAVVSSGTYIRSLARDIGAALGTGGYISALSRTSIGPYALTDAVPLAALTLNDLRPTL